MSFFNEYDRFEETGHASSSERLDRRYDAIIEDNKDILQGAKILDIGAHDGRWAFAALKAGASKVVGLDARQELLDHANENMEFYGIEKDRYEFRLGDVPAALYDVKEKYDVVLLLGFLYHTMKHHELLEAIKKINPKHIIIDTNVMRLGGRNPNVAAIFIGKETADDPLNAIQDQDDQNNVLVGIPTKTAIDIMLDYFGYEFKYYDWSTVPPHGSIVQYVRGDRVTLVATKKQA